MKWYNWFSRIGIYVIGLLFLAFGVAFSVNSNLGGSPVNSLPYVISLIVDQKLGTCVTVIFISYIFLQILILRKDFQWFNLAQILCPTLFGKFVDFAKLVVDCVAVGTGIVLSFVFLGGLFGIREGTVISAIAIGKVIPYVNKFTLPIIKKFCFPEEES